MLVEESEYYEGTEGLSVTMKHNYDKSANIDSVEITMTNEKKYGESKSTCAAAYEHDVSSDQWYLLSAGEWSKPRWIFNDNLLGEWNVSSIENDDVYSITITEVNGSQIRLEYHVVGEASVISGSATVTVENGSMYIPLPNGFHTSGYYEPALLVLCSLDKGGLGRNYLQVRSVVDCIEHI